MHRREALFLLPGLWPLRARPAGGRPANIAWQPPMTLARGAGQRGPWRQNDSRYDFVDDGGEGLAPNGTGAGAWVGQAG